MVFAFVFALGFAVALTLIVRASGLRVRREQRQPWPLVLPAVFAALAVGAWWFVTRGSTSEERLVNFVVLPSPSEVFGSFPRLHSEQGLVRSAWVSFMRVNLGVALGVLVAVPLGVYMATFPAIAAFFKPLSIVSAYLPTVVFVPLTVAWWGATEAQKVGFLALACFVALLPLVVKAIADVPETFLDVAVTKGASQWQLVRHVLFPVAFADIWDHLRGVYGVGWGWIIMAEVIAAEAGLGFLLNVSDKRNKAAFFAVILVILLIAFACDQIWRLAGRFLFPYRRRS